MGAAASGLAGGAASGLDGGAAASGVNKTDTQAGRYLS